MRNVICHYHIYKNSGTTFDGILTANYGDRHICFDGPFPYFSINQRELLKIIGRNRAMVAFSSHQINLPVPASLDVNILPVVFVRHPLLRVYSIYKFKRATFDGTETSGNAGKMEFDEWCRHSLGHAQEAVHVSNAQVRLLGGSGSEPALQRRRNWGMENDLVQAMRNLRSVELLARTENFDADVGRFPAILARYGIEFEVGDTSPLNVEGSDFAQSIEERIEGVSAQLQEETLAALDAANRQDMALYELAERLIDGDDRRSAGARE